jgi:hypothetical protein
MGTTAKPTRDNRTITVDFQNETTYVQLLLIDMINVVFPPDYLSSKNVKPHKDAKQRFVPAAT